MFYGQLEKQYMLSLEMLEKFIRYCPDYLWNKKSGGFVFWQQIYHTLCGMLFWTRQTNGEFIEPFQERNLYPELEQEPEGQLSKEEMAGIAEKAKQQSRELFAAKDNSWLQEKSIVYNEYLNIDIIIIQIRHMQYHIGHCNSILREHNEKAVEWIE